MSAWTKPVDHKKRPSSLPKMGVRKRPCLPAAISETQSSLRQPGCPECQDPWLCVTRLLWFCPYRRCCWSDSLAVGTPYRMQPFQDRFGARPGMMAQEVIHSIPFPSPGKPIIRQTGCHFSASFFIHPSRQGTLGCHLSASRRAGNRSDRGW